MHHTRMSIRAGLLLAIGLPTLAAAVIGIRDALDDRPNYAVAALPSIGTTLPSFRLPTLHHDTVSLDRFRGQPVVFALWSQQCSVSRAALAGVERLHRDYAQRGVTVVLLADDGDTTALRRTMHSAGVTLPVAYADGHLRRMFDRSRSAPERDTHRIKFGLPSFLIVDATGRVQYRETGVPMTEFHSGKVSLRTLRAALDSLLSR